MQFSKGVMHILLTKKLAMPRVTAVIDGRIVLSWGKMVQQMSLFWVFFSESVGLKDNDLR